jgi:hypothetical protein
VAGHYLYIDGGEITTWDGSGSNDGLQYANPQSDGNINTVPGMLLKRSHISPYLHKSNGFRSLHTLDRSVLVMDQQLCQAKSDIKGSTGLE